MMMVTLRSSVAQGAYRAAAQHGLAIVSPDTSPRMLVHVC